MSSGGYGGFNPYGSSSGSFGRTPNTYQGGYQFQPDFSQYSPQQYQQYQRPQTMGVQIPQNQILSQPQTVAPPRFQQPTMEQFQQTLSNPGQYSQGQIAGMYSKQFDPYGKPSGSPPNQGTPPPNPGTPAAPPPAPPTPPAPTPPGATPPGVQYPQGFSQGLLDAQNRGIDGFRAMDPKGDTVVTPQNAWFYGFDSIGRSIDPKTNSVMSTFSAPADGFQRTRNY